MSHIQTSPGERRRPGGPAKLTRSGRKTRRHTEGFTGSPPCPKMTGGFWKAPPGVKGFGKLQIQGCVVPNIYRPRQYGEEGRGANIPPGGQGIASGQGLGYQSGRGSLEGSLSVLQRAGRGSEGWSPPLCREIIFSTCTARSLAAASWPSLARPAATSLADCVKRREHSKRKASTNAGLVNTRRIACRGRLPSVNPASRKDCSASPVTQTKRAAITRSGRGWVVIACPFSRSPGAPGRA